MLFLILDDEGIDCFVLVFVELFCREDDFVELGCVLSLNDV